MPEPARFTIHLTAVVEDGQDGMSEMWDRIHDALDAIPGVFGEGGSSVLMPSEDVIAGSPLALALTDCSGGSAPGGDRA